MRVNFTEMTYRALFIIVLVLPACGGGDSASPAAKAANTVAVNFSVDDRANGVYQAGDLLWKGSFAYDAATRMITLDSSWTNPYVPLYDDGPSTAGGHEPAGAVAGDHIWGVTVFVASAASALTFEYGLVDHSAGDAWLWIGPNGTFNVASGAAAAITAAGQTLPLFGTTDMMLVLDTNALGSGPGGVPWTTASVKVKGSPWHWGLITLADNGANGDAAASDGIYTFVLSNYVGAGKTYPHSGLLNSADVPAFVFELDAWEYKDSFGDAESTGVTAFTLASGGSWTSAPVTVDTTSHNTTITIP